MNVLRNKKGQGATEYIVILALVVGLAVLLWKVINQPMTGKINQIGSAIQQTNTPGN